MKAEKLQSDLPVTTAVGSLRVEDSFYAEANLLRSQLEDALPARDHAGITPLTYIFSENRFQYLSASMDSVFPAECTRQLVETLADWADRELSTSHVSTPQVRVYVRGCRRSVLQDAVMLGWHYMLCLTRNEGSRKRDQVRMMILNRPDRHNRLIGACDLLHAELTFNRLIVHDTQHAYGIEPELSSMDPLLGTIILDGYLW